MGPYSQLPGQPNNQPVAGGSAGGYPTSTNFQTAQPPAPANPNLGVGGQPYAMPGAAAPVAVMGNTYNQSAAASATAPPMPTAPAVQAAATNAPKANPNSTQNSLQIAEVRDGIVIMNDGSFRSVVMVKSINFDLMSPQEREAVEFSYQGFLNSLYFPVQIVVRSQKVDLAPYIEKLDKIRTEHDNMLLAVLMEDYINFMDQLSQQTNIMDKKFYVVVPFFPTADLQKTLEVSKGFFDGLKHMFNSKPQQQVTINEADLAKAKDELRNRVQAVLGGLMQCGIQGLPLDTQELIELYYDNYNPDTATRQQLKNFGDLSAPVITKGAGDARQPELDREMQ